MTYKTEEFERPPVRPHLTPPVRPPIDLPSCRPSFRLILLPLSLISSASEYSFFERFYAK
ncbi:MAG: hypothetical protein II624_01865 [Prevotella sp.]|nr:hypothetical protein [Prevotella sp.]